MPLRGVTPQASDMRFKIMLEGPPGGGKSTAAIQVPDNYIIDMEKGTSRYYKTIQKNRGKVVQTKDWRVVEDEIQCLATEKHPFKTVTLDPITVYWELVQELWDSKFVAAQTREDLLQDFGMRFWVKVKKQYRRLRKILMDLDMNVILIAHEIDKYSGQQVVGTKPDSDKKDEFALDFTFRLVKENNKYVAYTLKQRIDIGDQVFPDKFIWSYDNLTKFYGKDALEKETLHARGDKIEIDPETIVKEEKKPVTTIITPDILEPIKSLLRKEKIKQDDFVIFLKDIVQWDIERLTDLTQKKVDLIMTSWESKILPKYQEMKAKEIPPPPPKKRKPKVNDKDKPEPIKEEDKPPKIIQTEIPDLLKIDDEQKENIKDQLEKNKVTEEQFFSFISVTSWDEITHDGAERLIVNLQPMLTALSDKE